MGEVAEWLAADDLWAARWLYVRGLGVVYAIAFVVTLDQFRPLLGERGLLPVPAYLERAPFKRVPSLFHAGYTDRRLVAVSVVGLLGSLAFVVGLPQAGPVWLPLVGWLVLWALYFMSSATQHRWIGALRNKTTGRNLQPKQTTT